MTWHGSVINGEIKLDQPTNLPDGVRVIVVLENQEEFGSFELPKETYGEFLESLRESIAESKSGSRGYSVDQAFTILEDDLHSKVNTSNG